MELSRFFKMTMSVLQKSAMSVLGGRLGGQRLLLKSAANDTSSDQSKGNCIGGAHSDEAAPRPWPWNTTLKYLYRSGLNFRIGRRNITNWSNTQEFWQKLYDNVDEIQDERGEPDEQNKLGLTKITPNIHTLRSKNRNMGLNGSNKYKVQGIKQVPRRINRSFLATLALSDPNVTRPDPPNDEGRHSYNTCMQYNCGRLKWEADINCPPLPDRCLKKLTAPKEVAKALQQLKSFSAATKAYLYRWLGRKLA